MLYTGITTDTTIGFAPDNQDSLPLDPDVRNELRLTVARGASIRGPSP